MERLSDLSKDTGISSSTSGAQLSFPVPQPADLTPKPTFFGSRSAGRFPTLQQKGGSQFGTFGFTPPRRVGLSCWQTAWIPVPGKYLQPMVCQDFCSNHLGKSRDSETDKNSCDSYKYHAAGVGGLLRDTLRCSHIPGEPPPYRTLHDGLSVPISH